MPRWEGKLPKALTSLPESLYVAIDESGREAKAVLRGLPQPYRLIQDRFVEIREESVWCRSCKDFSSAEALPTIADLERSFRKAESDVAEDRKNLNTERRKAHFQARLSLDLVILEDREAELNWRKRRSSPPRCLQCGSTAACFLEWQQDSPTEPPWFIHPDTGLRYDYRGDAIFHFLPGGLSSALYDEEGVVIKPSQASKPISTTMPYG